MTAIPPLVVGAGWLVSVNVGRPAETLWYGRTIRSSIWKSPVTGQVRASGVNLAGDAQADPAAPTRLFTPTQQRTSSGGAPSSVSSSDRGAWART